MQLILFPPLCRSDGWYCFVVTCLKFWRTWNVEGGAPFLGGRKIFSMTSHDDVTTKIQQTLRCRVPSTWYASRNKPIARRLRNCILSSLFTVSTCWDCSCKLAILVKEVYPTVQFMEKCSEVDLSNRKKLKRTSWSGQVRRNRRSIRRYSSNRSQKVRQSKIPNSCIFAHFLRFPSFTDSFTWSSRLSHTIIMSAPKISKVRSLMQLN